MSVLLMHITGSNARSAVWGIDGDRVPRDVRHPAAGKPWGLSGLGSCCEHSRRVFRSATSPAAADEICQGALKKADYVTGLLRCPRGCRAAVTGSVRAVHILPWPVLVYHGAP